MDKLKGKNTTFFNGGSKNFLSMKFFTIVTIHLCAPLDNYHKIIHMKTVHEKKKKTGYSLENFHILFGVRQALMSEPPEKPNQMD